MGHTLGGSTARWAAAAAAIALAVTSRGDVALLALVLGVAAADPLVGLTAGLAGLAVAARWGSTSLEAVAGAQAVVGPAGWTGDGLAVAAMWLAAAALVLAACPRETGASEGRWLAVLLAVAFGVAAATVVAGPAPGGEIGLRVLASVALAALAGIVALAIWPLLRRLRIGWARRVAPAACATLALISALAA